jgi:hypothetical protein
MAASAWTVPGPNLGPTGELAPPALTIPAQSRRGARRWLAWSFLPTPFLGFALGVSLAIAQAPPSELPEGRVGAPPPALTWPVRELEPRFWKPAGSTAVRPTPRFSQRRYHPPVRFAAGPTLVP